MNGVTLRACRMRAGMSQAQLGAAVGSCRERISDYERAKSPVPEDIRLRAAETLNAPELILDDLQVVFEADAQTALGWVIEELAEALEAARRQEERLRKGKACDLLDEQALWQPRTAIASYMVARARQGADVFAMLARHVEQLTKRGYLRRRTGVA